MENKVIKVKMGSLTQYGRLEGCVLMSSCENTKITTNWWITVDKRMLELTKKKKKKGNLMSKDKKPQWDGWKGTITIKSNPIPTGLATHSWRTIIPKKFSHCCEGLEPHIRLPNLETQKRTRNPQGIWPWRPVGFDYMTSTGLGETEALVLEDTNKTLYAPRLRGKEQWLNRKPNQNYLPVSEGLLWRHGYTGTGHRWCQRSWRMPLTWP